jgi:hypothetical protein
MKLCIFIISILLFTAVQILPAVNIEIDNGITVETVEQAYLEIDGELIETGSGYFKGKITSGTRSGLTQFAGLTLSTGLDGVVTRTSGTGYTKGNGEGINILRYYEINNVGSGTISADMQLNCVFSGTPDESNGLTGPYFVYRYQTDWTGYGDGSGGAPISAAGVDIPTGNSDWVISEGCRIASKIFLEGAYDDVSGQMRTSLSDYIPTTSPYAEDPRTIATVPTGVTDWVLLQVRSLADGSDLASRSCFIDVDGRLVADDGTTQHIGIKIKPGDYYLVIRHRNHLAVMSSSSQAGLTWGVTPTLYDFTTASSQFYGTNGAKDLGSEIWGMYGGEGNYSGIVTIADRNAALTERDAVGYNDRDYNLSEIVTISDANLALTNRDAACQVPQAVLSVRKILPQSAIKPLKIE